MCARGELNRKTTPVNHARTAALSVKPASRCLRFPPVASGPCTPGVHQPYPVEPTRAGRATVADELCAAPQCEVRTDLHWTQCRSHWTGTFSASQVRHDPTQPLHCTHQNLKPASNFGRRLLTRSGPKIGGAGQLLICEERLSRGRVRRPSRSPGAGASASSVSISVSVS